tara:strand:- start:69 stop:293 length:225 start_codon:yes stop_codon:yes gene_type:complete
MKSQILKSLVLHAKGKIEKHKANVHIYLENPAGIGEHSDVMEAIETELNQIATYEEQLDVISKHFYMKGIYNDK